jgi:hypothetical protein
MHRSFADLKRAAADAAAAPATVKTVVRKPGRKKASGKAGRKPKGKSAAA